MTDPKECSENAKRCVALAAQATDPVVQRRLLETAQGWMRLAFDKASGLSPYDCYWRSLEMAVQVSLRVPLVAALPFASAPRLAPCIGP